MADFTATQGALSALFAGIAAVIGAVVGRRSTTKVEPQPLSVKLEDKFAPKEGNAEAHRELFLRLAAVEQRSSKLEAEVGMIKTQLNRLEDKCDRILAILAGRDAPRPNLPQ